MFQIAARSCSLRASTLPKAIEHTAVIVVEELEFAALELLNKRRPLHPVRDLRTRERDVTDCYVMRKPVEIIIESGCVSLVRRWIVLAPCTKVCQETAGKTKEVSINLILADSVPGSVRGIDGVCGHFKAGGGIAMKRHKPEPVQITSGHQSGGVAQARRGPEAGAESARLSIDGQLVRVLLKSLGEPPVRVSLWNGDSLAPAGGKEVAHVRIASRASLLKLIVDPAYQFGECYCDGSLEVDGDLVELLQLLLRGLSENSSSTRKLIDWSRRRRPNTLADSRDNIHSHYDLGNAFYELWLDRQLVYTCAYFPSPETTLEEAQIAKMDHVCRKLRLQAGETVVEAGCGWGAFTLHMASRFGVQVKAYNISRAQVTYARARARALGVEQRVEFIEDDYRNISGRFDAFVSVGMLEHVGRENYHELGNIIDRVLAGNGRGLIHSIGLVRPAPLNAWIEKRIFPGAYPPSLREMLEVLEPSGFSVLDIENLRQHYALTLKHWLRRFENASGAVSEMYDERFVRAWRVYLCGSQAAFSTGEMQLFQVLFARQRSNEVAWTRAYLYEPVAD